MLHCKQPDEGSKGAGFFAKLFGRGKDEGGETEEVDLDGRGKKEEEKDQIIRHVELCVC